MSETGAPPTLEEVAEAMLSAYDRNALTTLLLFRWGWVLDEQVFLGQPYKAVMRDLVQLTEQQGQRADLVAIALAERPGNPKLQAVATQYGLTLPKVTQRFQPGRPKPATLEALVAERSRLIDFARFSQRLAQLGDCICRIEMPEPGGEGLIVGTGFLIAKNLVLTNYHVAAEVIADPTLYTEMTCRFDHRSDVKKGRTVSLSGPPLASSPYSQSDVTGDGEPGADELDYAILPLAEKIADTAGASGQPRGFIALETTPRAVARSEIVMVCQQAGGRELQMAWGEVTAFPGKGRRVRYDVTTENGSSGSPCLTADLDLVGLHHAADPEQDPKFNQAVPIWLVARHAEKAGVKLGGG